MPTEPIGIIGGSGLYELVEDPHHETVITPYGPPSGPISLGQIAGREIAFLTRHGTGHAIPPHLINYRANLAALAQLGVRKVLTSSAVGSLRADYLPGHFVLVDQFIDRTTGRADTFVEGPEVRHLPLADPYCTQLRDIARKVLTDHGEAFHPTGTAVVIQGPRFSTRAESQWYQAMGWDVLSMTQHPETALARELGMCVVNLSFVSDLDAGMPGIQDEPVTGDLVFRTVAAGQARIKSTLGDIVRHTPQDSTCVCGAFRLEPRRSVRH